MSAALLFQVFAKKGLDNPLLLGYNNSRKEIRRCSSMVECQLPKLNTRVRFPSSAPKERTAFGRFFLLEQCTSPSRVARAGSILPLGDRGACSPGAERANLRALHEIPVICSIKRPPRGGFLNFTGRRSPLRVVGVYILGAGGRHDVIFYSDLTKEGKCAILDIG